MAMKCVISACVINKTFLSQIQIENKLANRAVRVSCFFRQFEAEFLNKLVGNYNE